MDSFNPQQVANGLLGGLLLVLPVDIAIQGDPSLAHRGLDALIRHQGLPLQCGDGRPGDVGIGVLAGAAEPDLDVVDDRPDALDMLGHLLGRYFLGVARHVASKRHDAVADRDADRGRVDARLPLEFLEYIPLQLLVVLHLSPPSHRSVRSAHAGYGPLLLALRRWLSPRMGHDPSEARRTCRSDRTTHFFSWTSRSRDFFSGFFGAGMVTSSTPLWNSAVAFAGSVPWGSGMARKKLP